MKVHTGEKPHKCYYCENRTKLDLPKWTSTQISFINWKVTYQTKYETNYLYSTFKYKLCKATAPALNLISEMNKIPLSCVEYDPINKPEWKLVNQRIFIVTTKSKIVLHLCTSRYGG